MGEGPDRRTARPVSADLMPIGYYGVFSGFVVEKHIRFV